MLHIHDRANKIRVQTNALGRLVDEWAILSYGIGAIAS
jgi:hypothetical protein